jgi:hypothetical protein
MHGEDWIGRRNRRQRWTCEVEAYAWYPSHARLKCIGITVARTTGRPHIEAAYSDEFINYS